MKNEFDDIQIVYTRFINNANFEPTILRLFPIVKQKTKAQEKVSANFDFEPDVETIFEKTVNLYINTVIYGTIIESQVSEHASRRMAMESATKNGKELINDLRIKYNRQRQAAITQEISEIVGGANALNN
jgi:F-type H+-transporting ATPase subunit gamma